jgi:hypothetical protein
VLVLAAVDVPRSGICHSQSPDAEAWLEDVPSRVGHNERLFYLALSSRPVMPVISRRRSAASTPVTNSPRPRRPGLAQSDGTLFACISSP